MYNIAFDKISIILIKEIYRHSHSLFTNGGCISNSPEIYYLKSNINYFI